MTHIGILQISTRAQLTSNLIVQDQHNDEELPGTWKLRQRYHTHLITTLP